jgi:hypothetical protein
LLLRNDYNKIIISNKDKRKNKNNIQLRITSLVKDNDDDDELKKEGCEILDKINMLIYHRDK